jgi:hypothetical protein
MISESTCSGVSKISNFFLCEHFWVNKSPSNLGGEGGPIFAGWGRVYPQYPPLKLCVLTTQTCCDEVIDSIFVSSLSIDEANLEEGAGTRLTCQFQSPSIQPSSLECSIIVLNAKGMEIRTPRQLFSSLFSSYSIDVVVT